jgi:hypothetical protein
MRRERVDYEDIAFEGSGFDEDAQPAALVRSASELCLKPLGLTSPRRSAWAEP